MVSRALRRWVQTFRELLRFSTSLKSGLFVLLAGVLPLSFFLSGYPDASALEKNLTDAKIRMLSKSMEMDPRLVILEIDAESLGEIKSQWPWPRAIYAELLRSLLGQRPTGIIFTILFQQLEKKTEPSPGDQALIEMMKEMGNVYLPQLIQEEFFGTVTKTSLLAPHDAFCAASRGLGFSKVLLDEDNMARLAVYHLPGFSARSLISFGLSALNPGESANPDRLFDGKNLMVMYAGRGRIPRIPLSHLLDPSWKQEGGLSTRPLPDHSKLLDFFHDKLVFVGVTAPILHDQFYTPGGYLSGVEILANGVNTLLQRVLIRNFSGIGVKFLLIIPVFLGALIFLADPERSHGARLGLLIAGILIILGINFGFFRYLHWQTPCVYLIFFIGYLYLAQTMSLGFRERLAKETLEKELEIGRQMQASLLPKDIPRVQGVEIFAESRSAKEIGGDLFDFISFSDGRLGLLIGDVAGKGVQAGLFMGMASLMLKHKGSQTISPAEALCQTSRAFRDHFDGIAPTYLTACFAIFDPISMELSVANAGHEPPICLVPPESRAEQIPLYGPPLGPVWLLDQIEYSTRTIPVVEGLQVIFFSDGFTEAFNEGGQTFGKERFLETISGHADQSPHELGQTLFTLIDEHEKNMAPSDDKTLVILRFSGKARKLPALIDETLDHRFSTLWASPAGLWKTHDLPADISLLNSFSDGIRKEMQKQKFSTTDLFAVELLLEEAFSNAWKHGCGKDPGKHLRVLEHISPDAVEIYIRDEGPGFSPTQPPSSTPGENSFPYRDSGRGLELLRRYSHRVAYNPLGTMVYLKRMKTPQTSEGK